MNTINIEEVLRIKNPKIIDIRSLYDYNEGHIPGSISLPYYNLLNNHSHYLTNYNTYYLYCDYGLQSKEISERLNSFGYKTYSIIGGYQEYLKVFGIT